MGGWAKNGLKIVIAGRPNVGKSSLMNCLSGHNRVIVTPYAGTTRDTVEEEIELGGFPLKLWDTAGLQETSHPVEKEGIERSKLAVAEADLVLYVLDGSREFDPEDAEFFEGLAGRGRILVVNKSDLPQKLERALLMKITPGCAVVSSSCADENGTRGLEEAILRFITAGGADVSGDTVISTVRQKELLEKIRESVERAEKACRAGLSPECVASDLRLALEPLGALVGDVYTDDVLERLFSQFCIGK